MILNENLFECFNPDDLSTDKLDLEADEREKELKEDFSSYFPTWFTKNLSPRDKGALSKAGVDLNKADFIEDDPPISGWDPRLKNNSYIPVYLVRGRGSIGSTLYIPGIINDNFSEDLLGNGSYIALKNYSKKQIGEHSINFGYIDMSVSSNSNKDLKKARELAKKGDINLDREKHDQYAYQSTLGYKKNQYGYSDFNNPILGDVSWITQKGYDKSGYKLDPDKFKNLLISNKIKDTSSIDEMVSKIEDYKNKLSDKLKDIDIKDRSSMSSFTRCADALSDMINEFSSSFENMESISKYKDQVEKEEELSYTLRQLIKNFYIYEKRFNEYFKNIKSSVKVECLHSVKEGVDNNLDLFNEFVDIASEIGLNSVKDLEYFKEEELGDKAPTIENLLDAIKRYKQELIDAGVDLKNLQEGVMSEIDLEIKDIGGKENYIKKLEKDISKLEKWINFLKVEAPKQVKMKISNFDTQEEVDEAIDEANEELTEKKAKLKFIQ